MGKIACPRRCAHDLNSKQICYAQSCPSESLVISIIDLISRLHLVQTFLVAAPPRTEPMSQIALRNNRKPAECLILGRGRLGFAPGRLNKTRSCAFWPIGQRTLVIALMSCPKAQLHKPVTCAMNACNICTQFFKGIHTSSPLAIDMRFGKGGWMVTSRKVLPARPGCDRMEQKSLQQLQVRCETF